MLIRGDFMKKWPLLGVFLPEIKRGGKKCTLFKKVFTFFQFFIIRYDRFVSPTSEGDKYTPLN